MSGGYAFCMNSNVYAESTEMDFNNYQFRTRLTAKYPQERALEYLVLGLASEAGEVAGKYKKIIRDNNGVLDDESKQALAAEVGDVLWYCSELATELGINLGAVAQQNINKLQSRKERGVIGGSGDNR